MYYIHGKISDGINARPLQETVSFYRSVFLSMPEDFPCLVSTPRSRVQIRVELVMTRASWETGLPIFEDKNGNGNADDKSLEMCFEMVVGHAVDSAVL
jgi:hypothetical protein